MKSFNPKTSYIRSVLLLFSLIVMLNNTLSAQTFPSGFSQVRLATLNTPMGLAAAPDGRLFICEKGGDLLIYKNGALLPTPAIHLNPGGVGEGGLLSLTFDPDFATNQYIYVYYTAPNPNHNRLSRFTMTGDVTSISTEKILLELDPLLEQEHMGGGISFGPDGRIYLASGENMQGARVQQLDNFFGKIIRMNRDGSAPDDNPFASNPNAAAKYIWSIGFRNPYTLSIQPNTGKIFVNDIGSDPPVGIEEINDVTIPGKNYGWPVVEGNSSNASYTNPYYKYTVVRDNATTDLTAGCAITGGVFYNPASTNFPSSYYGKYFFVDFCNQWINYLDPAAATPTIQTFSTGTTLNITNLVVGANGSLYYITNNNAGLYNIVYNVNSAPTIVVQPENKIIPQNQSASFSVGVIGTAPLSYQWKKNGTNISGATASTYTIASVAATDAGQYSVLVTNTVGNTLSANASLTVTAPNTLPVPTITAPTASTQYSYGDIISFAGTATDQEDGTLPASAYTWKIQLHHNEHFHPVLDVTGVKSGTFPINISEPDTDVRYRVTLTVTDSRGQSTTTFREIAPRLTTITLATNPVNMQLTIDGRSVTAPYNVISVVGMPRKIAAPPQVFGGTAYEYSSWSNSGAQIQTISTPVSNTTYTANFVTGTNLALNKPALASTTNGASTAAKAFDGNSTSTRWESASADPQWIYVDLGQTYNVKHIKIVWETALARDYKVEIAPNTTDWLPVKSLTGNAQLTNDLIYLDTVQNHIGRYIRVYGTKRATTYGYSIYEMEVYGDPVSSNPAPVVALTSPANNASFAEPASIVINATATDDGSVSKVEFFNGATKLGEDLSSPYTYTWSSVVAGTYSITAKATDNLGASTSSSAVSVTVTSSTAVNLALNKTSTASTAPGPANNATDGNPGTRWESAAADPQWIYVDLGASYTVNRVKITWETALAKDYRIEVSNDINNWGTPVKTVTNNTVVSNDWAVSGTGRYVRMYGTARGTQWAYSIWELEVYGTPAGGNQSPTAAITSPINNATFTAPASITITATATDPDGNATISKVEFYNGATKLGEDASSPYSFAWTSVPTGTYSITAKAIDNLNATGTSAVVDITVGTNTAPTVSITAPANNATFASPATITITANAADADGIARVEFYNGASKLGEDASSPYSYTWSGVGAGTYSITAKAVDNLNGSTTTSPVSVTVTGSAVNLALNKTATASSVENAGTPASGAVDGNATTTRWASAFSDPQWIYVDLGANYNVDRVKITWEGAKGKDYVIQVSNDLQNWGTAVKTVTGNTALVNDWTGLSGTGRYVRMYGTARATGYGYSIYELEVYGTSAGARVALVDEEVEAGIHVTVFPNPASEQVAVSILADQDEIAEIGLYNQAGQELIVYSYTLVKGENKAIIPVSEYSEGSYLLVISSQEKKITQRLMIVK